jgi:hypothetical protein
MEWLNLHTSVLDSPEVIGSDPVERGTWLMLLRYCIGQENSGIIRDCADWKDRKWQQVIRVTLSEVQATSELWTWKGNDLHVHLYPVEKEAEVHRLRAIGKQTTPAKQRAARDNGKKSTGRPKTQQETEQKPNTEPSSVTQQKPNTEPNDNPTGNRTENPTETQQKTHRKEGKGKEGERKGKEEEEEKAAASTAAAVGAEFQTVVSPSPSTITPDMLVAAYPRRSHLADALREAAACMKRHDPAQILAGTKAIAEVVSRWTESERMTFLKKPPEFFAGDHWADDPALWMSRRERSTAIATTAATDPNMSLGGRKPSLQVTL